MAQLFKEHLDTQDTEKEVVTALVQMSVYAVFAIVTTILSLSNPTSNIFFFRQSLDAIFINREDDFLRTNFEYLVNIDDWIQHVELFFLTKLASYSNRPENRNSSHILIDENHLYGVPRIRQIRVKPEECADRKALKTKFQPCFPPYSYGKEETELTYKGTYYFNRTEFRALPFLGSVGKYSGPGYLVIMDFDYNQNLMSFQHMKNIGWIDGGTRLVLIELIIYNIDTLLVATVQLGAEVFPTGTIIPHWEIDIMPLTTIWSPDSLGVLFASIVFFALVIFYTSVEIQELLESGAKHYFSSPKNYIDIIILTSAFVYLELSIICSFNIHHFAYKMMEEPDTLISLDNIFFAYSATIFSMAICVFLVWAKVLRFIGFNKTMIQFQTTLRRCTKDILGFATMFAVVFMAFSLCGLIIFGDTRKDFSTFQDAFFSMVRMVLGDFQFTNLQYTNRIICPAFYLLYILFISLILLNMFLAIINNTYTDVKKEIREEKNALKAVIIKYYKKIKDKILRRNKRKQARDLPEEKRITANVDDEMQIWEDFGEVKLKEETARKSSMMNPIRRPFKRPHSTPLGVVRSKEDHINEDLERLSERIGLLEALVVKMSVNINTMLRRTDSPNRTDES